MRIKPGLKKFYRKFPSQKTNSPPTPVVAINANYKNNMNNSKFSSLCQSYEEEGPKPKKKETLFQ